MAQQSPADWVDFQTIKAKLRFSQVLSHLGLMDGIDEKEEELTGPCPICKAEGFKVNLEKNTFSCPGCKKRGSVIDFVSAYKKVGLKEAGKLLKEILEASATPQVKETSASKPARKRKGKGSSSQGPAPAFLAQAFKEEIMATAQALQEKLKEAQGLAAELMAKLEGKV